MDAPLAPPPLEKRDSSAQEAEPAEPPPRASLKNVQALRALAALMVVFVHVEPLVMRAGLAPRAFEFGNAGVDIFFVISGFIMVFTTGRKPLGPAAFLGNRLRRITPLYWTITLLVFALALTAPRLLQGTRADPAHLLASLAFAPHMRADGTARPVVFVGWTLNYEMAFYVVFAAGLALRRRLLGVGLTLAALVAAVAWARLQPPHSVAGQFYTQPIILEFGLGMALGLAWPRLPETGPAWLAAAGALAFLAVATILMYGLVWPGAERALVFGLPAFVLVGAALVLEKGGLFVPWDWIRRLGDASYAVYLTHFFVTQAMLFAARKAGLTGIGAAALAALALPAAASVGMLVHEGLEKPLDRLVSPRKLDRIRSA